MQSQDSQQPSQDDGDSGEEEEQKRKRAPPVFRRASAPQSRPLGSGSPLAPARPLQLPPPILRLLPSPPVPEPYVPTRPAKSETIQQTRSRLYQHHKRNGTLAVFYQMYPSG